MTVVSLREYIFVIVGSVVLSLALIAVLFSWARQARTLITIALTITIGIIYLEYSAERDECHLLEC